VKRALASLAVVVLAATQLVSCGNVLPRHRYQVIDRVQEFGDGVEQRLKPAFNKVGLAYPPRELAYVAFKDTKLLEVYGRNSIHAPWTHALTYPVLAASGGLGPKLREGDRQVPEGIYALQDFNANSKHHLSLLIGYPNDFDRAMAEREGRIDLGGEIMIHGDARSAGCLAVGDQAAEDFFVLTAITSKERVRVIISPTDFRVGARTALPADPPWLPSLYQQLRAELQQFPRGGGDRRSGLFP
jgi:hypothetical protein